MRRTVRSTPVCAFLLPILAVGCAPVRFATWQERAQADTYFELIAAVDTHKQEDADVRALLQPGDLIINYTRVGRALARKEPLFCLLPYGHSILVIDPDEEFGLLEVRFRGARRVSLAELDKYSFSHVFRLRDAHRLDVERLREFDSQILSCVRRYDFLSWVGHNENMMPDSADEVGVTYNCSSMVTAAYHYAGVTLRASKWHRHVITPLSVAASEGWFNKNSRHHSDLEIEWDSGLTPAITETSEACEPLVR